MVYGTYKLTIYCLLVGWSKFSVFLGFKVNRISLNRPARDRENRFGIDQFSVPVPVRYFDGSVRIESNRFVPNYRLLARLS